MHKISWENIKEFPRNCGTYPKKGSIYPKMASCRVKHIVKTFFFVRLVTVIPRTSWCKKIKRFSRNRRTHKNNNNQRMPKTTWNQWHVWILLCFWPPGQYQESLWKVSKMVEYATRRIGKLTDSSINTF